MKKTLALLSVATVLVASNLSARQSAVTSDIPAVRFGIPASSGEFTPQVLLHIQRGDALQGTMRFTAAAREYRRAADIARREGHLASGTTWMLANAYFNNDNLLDAAAALDQLSTEASHEGDLAVEALALFNSAWLNGKAGRKTETAARVAQLVRILRSPYMPIAIRDHLNSLLKTWTDVAVAAER